LATPLEHEADEAEGVRPADPAGLVRGMGTVFAVWGTALIACHFIFRWHTWTFAVGLAFWAAALAATRRRRQEA